MNDTKTHQGLAELRDFCGSRTTVGLSDSRLAPFAGNDDLSLAIEEAVAMHRSLRPKWGEALAGSEEDLAQQVQSGFLNFYTPETVNPFVALAARGPWIVTSHGAVIHDSGGYGMLGLGHAPRAVLAAMAKPWVMANVMTPSMSQAHLAEALRAHIGTASGGCPYVAFQCLNSGSESVTLACRISDLHAKQMTATGAQHAGRRPMFLALEGAFHGRTDRPALLSDSSRGVYEDLLASHDEIDTLVTIPANDIAALEAAFDSATKDGRFIELMAIEPVQGEGNPGIACTREFYDAARRLTHEHGSLLLMDSIQAGFRTTGHLSVVDYPGFEGCEAPDLETYSKALNAGQYPLSVLALGPRAAEIFRTGIYGNTMTTNPRALEVAVTVLSAIDETMQRNIRDQGLHLLRKLDGLKERYPELIVRNQGTGLLVASVIRDDVRVVGVDGLEQRCRRLGLGVIHGGKNALRFTPHFGITDAEIDLMTDVLDEVMGSVA